MLAPIGKRNVKTDAEYAARETVINAPPRGHAETPGYPFAVALFGGFHHVGGNIEALISGLDLSGFKKIQQRAIAATIIGDSNPFSSRRQQG